MVIQTSTEHLFDKGRIGDYLHYLCRELFLFSGKWSEIPYIQLMMSKDYIPVTVVNSVDDLFGIKFGRGKEYFEGTQPG